MKKELKILPKILKCFFIIIISLIIILLIIHFIGRKLYNRTPSGGIREKRKS